MFKINPGDAQTDLYGKGKGDAHVWDFSSVDKAVESHRKAKALKIAEAQKTGDSNQNKVNAELAKMDTKYIHPNDQPYFAEQQKQIYDFTRDNISKLRSGDANTQLQFQQMMGKLGQEAELSKNFREGSEAIHQGVVSRKDANWRPETLKDFDAAQAAPYKTGWDATKLLPKENYNIDHWVGGDLLTEVQKTSEGVESEYMDPKTGEKVKVDPNNFSPKEAHDFLFDKAKGNPQALEQAQYDLSKMDKATQDKYSGEDGLASYIADTKSGDLVFNKSKYSRVATSDSGVSTIEESTTEKPLTYNIETNDVEGKPMKGTVDVAARTTLNKPIKVTGAVTEGLITVNGNKPIDKASVVDVEIGEVNVVPVYKDGAKNAKGESMAGHVVPSERLAQEKKKGGVEYKSMANGIATMDNGRKDNNGNPVYEKVSVTKPANELKGALDKVKVPLGDLNKKAEDLNKKHAVKNEVARKTKDGKVAIFDADTKQFIRYQ